MVLVSVRCLVYNQRKFIRQCLEGIVKQQTNFPFEAVVHDDASTDGTQEIILEYAHKYPHIIKPILEQENQYSKHDGSLRRAIDPFCNGKYIAYCEGDDYWTDPHKLQKQVDILESDPSISMVYTGFATVDEEGNGMKRFDFDFNQKWSRSGFILNRLLYRNFVMTVSCIFRRDAWISMDKQNCKCSLDYSQFLAASICGRAVFLPEKTCCYRFNHASLTNSNREYIIKLVMFVLDYYTEKITTADMPFSKWQWSKINLYIAARGLDLWIRGVGKSYLQRYTLKRNSLWLIPALFLEAYLLFEYYSRKWVLVNLFHQYRTEL